MQIVSRNFIQDFEIIEAPSPTPSDASTSSSELSSFKAPPPKRAPAKDPPFRLDGKRREHILAKFPPLKSKSGPSRGCRVCQKHKIRSETTWYCIKCGVPLHPGICDTKYHILKFY